jgi:hypothetical protein
MTIIPALGISGRQIPFLNLLRSDCDQFKVDLGIGREFAQLAFNMLGGMCATRIAIKECIDVCRLVFVRDRLGSLIQVCF